MTGGLLLGQAIAPGAAVTALDTTERHPWLAGCDQEEHHSRVQLAELPGDSKLLVAQVGQLSQIISPATHSSGAWSRNSPSSQDKRAFAASMPSLVHVGLEGKLTKKRQMQSCSFRQSSVPACNVRLAMHGR